MKEKMSVKPVIRDSKVIGIEIGGVSLPLKKSLSFEELPDLVNSVDKFFTFIDVDRLGEILTKEEEKPKEWDDENFLRFILTQLKESQALAFRILVDVNEVTRKQFIAEMQKLLGDDQFGGWNLGGLLAGITMKSKSWGYENPIDREWRMIKDKEVCLYRLAKPRYRKIVSAALEKRQHYNKT